MVICGFKEPFILEQMVPIPGERLNCMYLNPFSCSFVPIRSIRIQVNCAHIGSTYIKIEMMKRLVWHLYKHDAQICEAFHIKKKISC